MKTIRFAWVCRNIKFDEICREELTDEMLLNGSYPSYITSDNCEIIAKILPIGSKDKNGVEIWQGDVLNLPGMDTRHEVVFLQGEYQTGFKKRSGDQYTDIGTDTTHRLEIIGNIYENPELLK